MMKLNYEFNSAESTRILYLPLLQKKASTLAGKVNTYSAIVIVKLN